MPRFAANLSMLFAELPFMQRFAAARAAGFEAVECQFPYAHSTDELAQALRTNGLRQVLLNLPAGNWEAGERGIACHPQRVAEFQDGVEQAMRYATVLACPQVNCLAGIVPPGADSAEVHHTLIGNLRHAAARLQTAGIRLLIEPINTYDIPGFFLNRTAQALTILDEVGSDNLRIQYDVYHAQRMEGELANTLRRHLSRIGHIQVADNPGRHEPGTGEINYAWLFQHIDAIGYDGWVGCEYKPLAGTDAGLGWRMEIGS
ncbi:hydroxypyruvate isomerase [Rhodoferax sp.]|uniref:hydroxypyruvate isomerase n=1 Tax=Rhodoferax sp. TaxID=50421 RepID=UPI002779259B|nr:hydroxypyruvate isomerase [Rhodoferax sp.]